MAPDTKSPIDPKAEPVQAALAKVIRKRRQELPSSGKRKTPGYMSQEDLAGAANLTVSSIKRLERGLGNPTWESVVAVAKGLDLSLQELGERVDPLLPKKARKKPGTASTAPQKRA